MSDPIISVVICTYNRMELLKAVLNSLVRQTIGSSKYEVIVVDNNSTDSTQTITNEFVSIHRNFRLICDTRQGKSYAANTGISASKGKYIAFIDDDAKATPEWLERIVNAFYIVEPKPSSVGGSIYPWYEQSPPDWFSDDIETRSYAEKEGFLEGACANFGFSGSNMAFPRELLNRYGGFNVKIGPVGKKFGIGEETALFYKIYKKEPFFWYDPNIRVEHWVPAFKMCLSYQLKRAYLCGVANVALKEKISFYFLLQCLAFITFSFLTIFFRVAWWKKGWERKCLEHVRPMASCIGTLKGIILHDSRQRKD